MHTYMVAMFYFLESIPGPVFLLMYALYCSLVIGIAYLLIRFDKTRLYDVPEPTSITPLEMALLTKGINGAISLSFYNLLKHERIVVKREQLFLRIKAQSSNTDDLNRFEKLLLLNLQKEKRYYHFFSLQKQAVLKEYLTEETNKLTQLNLLGGKHHKQRAWLISILTLALLLVVGILKMKIGIERDKPVTFLFFEMAIAASALIYSAKPYTSRLTELGRKFVAASETRFRWMKTVKTNTSDNSELYAIALFGFAGIVGSLYAMFENQTYWSPVSSNTSGSSDSNSGCSGSGCSGSSCSGGSSGCGGCGGGGD